MDDLDLELVRRIGVAPFLVWPHEPPSVAALAKRLRVSKETVRRRLTDLERSKVIAGRVLVPNFRALGLNACTVHFRADDVARKSESLPALAALDGVLGVYDMLGPDVCVDLCFRDDADREAKVAAMRRVIGPASSSLFLAFPLPGLAKPFSPLDWRIVRALMEDATRSSEDVAAEIGVSARTVKRRLAALLAGGGADIVGAFDPGKLQGHVVVYLLLRLRENTGRSEASAIRDAFGRRWLAQWSPPERDLADAVVVTVVSSAGDVENLRREAMTLPAVVRAETLILSGAASAPAWLVAAVEARAAAKRIRAEVPRVVGRTPSTR